MINKKKSLLSIVLMLLLSLLLVACGSTEAPAAEEEEAPAEEEEMDEEMAEEDMEEEMDEEMAEEDMEEDMEEEAPADDASGLDSDAATVADEFFSQEQYDRSIRQMGLEAEGDPEMPWTQVLEPEFVDTSEFAQEGPYTFCFSNAGVNNPWRVVGFTTMTEEVALHPEIEEFIHVDAEGSDEKQISDIADLVASGECDVLIVSPNTTAALTPAVEQACEELPVIVFDRGVFTDCPVSFVQPIGGYAFGETGARHIIDNCPDGCNVVALRILPGVDVLEERWAAAKLAFEEAGNIDVVVVEFTDGDNANTKAIVTDALDRFGTVDAVWMDAGATSVAALEAFEDAGQPFPIIVGEDQQDFLIKWQEEDINGISPTFPTFQWRTPIIAGLQIMAGEEVPAVWRLPQPTITNENLDDFVQPNMPPLHYAMCGCEDMPNFPEAWGGE